MGRARIGRTDGLTDGRTDGRTDKAATICSPQIVSGSITSYEYFPNTLNKSPSNTTITFAQK